MGCIKSIYCSPAVMGVIMGFLNRSDSLCGPVNPMAQISKAVEPRSFRRDANGRHGPREGAAAVGGSGGQIAGV